VRAFVCPFKCIVDIQDILQCITFLSMAHEHSVY